MNTVDRPHKVRVKMLVSTGWMCKKLAPGDITEVAEDVATRWVKARIAEIVGSEKPAQ